VLGDHADAVALPQTREKVFLGPVELEALALNLENFGHVPPDHPADLNTEGLILKLTGAHTGLLAGGIFQA
jgi:hypothetical protein